ncbi:hypothetical protein C8R45DRAFT_395776 [Mycena sanguinolenta]|nr:hypothetical protein C8R45DRAFT_395776 [Mycena sanguinolenta]
MVLTRRAHRRRMDISRWLPNEVIVQIIQHSAQADQAILARASKLFHDLCLPILYRVVKIADFPDTIASFHSAIIENPSRADVVRSFTLVRPHDNLNHFSIQSRRDLLIATLKLMLNLDHLSVSRMALNEYYRRILLAECNFPRLSSCDIWVPRYSSTTPPADLVAGFLARHPNLKRVHLHSHPAMDVDVEPSVRISLPNLEYYAGDAAFFFPINAIGFKGGSTHLVLRG